MVPFIVYLKKQISLFHFAFAALTTCAIGMIYDINSTVRYNIGELKYVSYFMLGYVIRKVTLQILSKFPRLAWGGYCINAVFQIYI